MVGGCKIIVSAGRRCCRFETPEVMAHTVYVSGCNEAVGSCLNAPEAGAIFHSGVDAVLRTRGQTEICLSVVKRIAVPMINLLALHRSRDLSVHKYRPANAFFGRCARRDIAGAGSGAAIEKREPLVSGQRGKVRPVDQRKLAPRKLDALRHATRSERTSSLAASILRRSSSVTSGYAFMISGHAVRGSLLR